MPSPKPKKKTASPSVPRKRRAGKSKESIAKKGRTGGPSILVAGASGYIGKEIILRLLEKHPDGRITALSRSAQVSDDPRVDWKSCDLFSLKSLEGALPERVDLAFYLVHSMGPTAQLDQGSFADYDLLLADNFARALKGRGLKQCIYLGGLVPAFETLSLHLRSRREVEETFRSHGLPMTIFRAGLILGEAGTSFQILIKLVRRLPVMVCPSWTQTETTPVDLETVLTSLSGAAGDAARVGKTYDLAGCRPLTYIDMMNATARRMGLRRLFLTVPFFTPTLSRLWVRLITNTPKDLVYPLIESLKHPMLARSDHLYSTEGQGRTYAALLETESMRTRAGSSLFRFRVVRKTVRSVQRLPLPSGRDAVWVKDHFLDWLPKSLSPWIGVERDGERTRLFALHRRLSLLDLRFSADRSDPDRQLLYVVGGFLVGKGDAGRLEFRVVLGRKHVLAAIHDFRPALPWYVYVFTQALVHLFVMKTFARHLAK